MEPKELFRLKKPCANCPFRNDGNAINLSDARFKEIVESITQDDSITFPCHKTVYDSDGRETKNQSAYCVGAMAYLYKTGQPNVAMRLGFATGLITESELEELRALTKNPIRDES